MSANDTSSLEEDCAALQSVAVSSADITGHALKAATKVCNELKKRLLLANRASSKIAAKQGSAATAGSGQGTERTAWLASSGQAQQCDQHRKWRV